MALVSTEQLQSFWGLAAHPGGPEPAPSPLEDGPVVGNEFAGPQSKFPWRSVEAAQGWSIIFLQARGCEEFILQPPSRLGCGDLGHPGCWKSHLFPQQCQGRALHREEPSTHLQHGRE